METWFDMDVSYFSLVSAFFQAKFDLTPREAGAVNR